MTSSDESFIIASFNHKFPVDSYPNIQIKEEESSSSSKKKSKTISKYRMNVDGVKMEYVGDHSNNSTGADWCLMIKNKKTCEIVFKPAKFVVFSPDFGRQPEIEEGEKTPVDKKNYREMRDLLTLKYGSKQKKRALEAKMGSAISKDSLSNMINNAVSQVKESAETSFMDSSMIKVEVENGVVISPSKRVSAVLPCFNPEATSPAEIYDLNDIIGPNDIVLVSNEAAAFANLTQSERKNEGYSEIVLDLCQNLPAQVDARRTRCVYILYLNYLLGLCKVALDKRTFDMKDLEKIPQDICSVLFERYTDASFAKNSFNKRTVSNQNKDKLLSHCIVLLLNLNQFAFSVTKLLMATSSTDQKLSTICRLLGCNVKKSSQTGEKLVTLASPPKASNTSFADSKRFRR